MKVRKRYSKDFKDLVISQILLADGISVAELARRYEIYPLPLVGALGQIRLSNSGKLFSTLRGTCQYYADKS